MRFLPGNAQHIGARHSQQDSFGFADPDDAAFIEHGGFLAVVCDGMGGMEHGDAASRAAVRAFLEAYGLKSPEESVPAALERSVRAANERVVALARSLGKVEGIGTTLVGATLLRGGPGQARLYWVSVGDSGLFHVGNQRMRMVNHTHVYANHLDLAVAHGAITVEAALSHPERESLTSFIGAEVLEEIDLTTEPLILADGDTILLASDGMFKTLAQEEIAACLQGDPQSWPDVLVERTLASKRQSQDNVTVLSVSVAPEEIALPQAGVFARPGELAQPPAPAITAPAYAPQPGPVPPVAGPASLDASSIGGIPVGGSSSGPPPANWPLPEVTWSRSPSGTGYQTPASDSASPLGPEPPGSGYGQAFPPQPPSAFQAAAAGQTFVPLGSGAGSPSQASQGYGWVWMILLVVLLAVAGAGWWYWSSHPDFLHRASDGPRVVQPSGPGGQANAPPRDPNLPIPLPDPSAPAVPESAGNTGSKEGAAR